MSTKTQLAGRARTRVTVGDYEHEPAADAAIALRRAGLRPALERTFHWGKDTHGMVVAQEPPAGSEAPLDSTVLLFVSAPGERDTPDSSPERPRPGTEQVANKQHDELEELVRPVETTVRGRRRKPGLSPSGPVTASTRAPAEVPEEGDPWKDRQEPLLRHGEPAVPLDWSADQRDCGGEEALVEWARVQLAAAPGLPGGRSASRPGRRVPVSQLPVVATVALALGLLLILLGAHAHALQAAGAFNGTPISGVQTFVEKLRGNLVWLGGTAMGLVIAVVGIMFMAGHSRAHDLAIRTLMGLAILASISGIVA
ncbi:MAG: PASTA domain-containing protein [Solirubrobacteraceae bacterium]